MSDDYDGLEVIDREGVNVGKVERTYVDDSNAPRYVEVKFGALLPKHRLIPVSDSDVTDDGRIKVPNSREEIESSPDAPKSDTLQPTDLDRIDSYYEGFEAGGGADSEAEPMAAGDQATRETSTGQSDPSARDQFKVIDESTGSLRVGDQVPAGMEAPTRDRGDVIEVPVLEEVLVKKTVVREILRVRKSDVVEQETVDADVRKEGLEVDDQSGAASDHGIGSTPH